MFMNCVQSDKTLRFSPNTDPPLNRMESPGFRQIHGHIASVLIQPFTVSKASMALLSLSK